MTIWDDSRLDELDALEKLLRELTVINNGSGCLQRITNCIEIAERLASTDWDLRRPSFISWLNQQAIASRQAEVTQ